MGVHRASATTEKQKWRILNPRFHCVEFFFLNLVMLCIIGKLLNKLSYFYKKTIG